VPAQSCANTRTEIIDIAGKRCVWRELLQRRREQVAAAAKVAQSLLFGMKEDSRPPSGRGAPRFTLNIFHPRRRFE
jgi:hypothetical protein